MSAAACTEPAAAAAAVVGNDVVDLRDPDACRTVLHARFDARAFDADERGWIAAASAAAAHRRRWALWAAKEAAHKALRQQRPELGFAPGHYRVRLAEDGRGHVRRGADVLAVAVWIGAEWVHAVASRGEPSALPSGVARLDTLGETDPSRAVRRLLARSLTGAEVRLERTDRIPRLWFGGRRVAASLSHHGRFVAFAREGVPARDANGAARGPA